MSALKPAMQQKAELLVQLARAVERAESTDDLLFALMRVATEADALGRIARFTHGLVSSEGHPAEWPVTDSVREQLDSVARTYRGPR